MDLLRHQLPGVPVLRFEFKAVRPTCGCTVAEYTSEIAAGATGGRCAGLGVTTAAAEPAVGATTGGGRGTAGARAGFGRGHQHGGSP